jgi:hypothetical protein
MSTDLVVNRVPLAIRAAIERRRGAGKLVLLHEVDHPDGYIRAWSGTGTLVYGGFNWLGLGDLVAIDGLGGARQTVVRVVTVTLAGVTATQLAFITRKVRGRSARLSIAALALGTRTVDGDIFSVCYGLCDTQDHKADTGGKVSVVLTVNQPLFILDRASNAAWTPAWLKANYGSTIVGLDDLPGVAARIESWLP